jgi:Tfp pilus assembly protein PilF
MEGNHQFQAFGFALRRAGRVVSFFKAQSASLFAKLAIVLLIGITPAGHTQDHSDTPTFATLGRWAGSGYVEAAINSADAHDLFRTPIDEKDPAYPAYLLLRDARAIRVLPEQRRKIGIDQFEKDVQEVAEKFSAENANLIAAVSRYVDHLTGVRQRDEEQYEAALRKCDKLIESGKFQEAVTQLGNMPGVDGVSSDLSHRAALFKLRAETALATGDEFWPTLKREAGTSFEKIFGWLVYIVIVVALVSLLAALRRKFPAKKGTRMAVDDMTCAADDRDAASQALGRELSNSISSLEEDGNHPERVDLANDIDGLGVAHLRISVDGDTSVKSFVQSSDPVTVGPFSITPRQLLDLCSSYFRRPSEFTLRGALSKRESDFAFSVERVSSKGEVAPGERWEEVEKNRQDTVRKMARRIGFVLGGTCVTKSWRSFETYERGNEYLSQKESPGQKDLPDQKDSPDARPTERLKRALDCFCESLRYDPFNCMARFNLATTYRMLGQNDRAVHGFQNLEELLLQNPATEISNFSAKNPEFLGIVRYNRAVSLAKSTDEGALREATDLLEALIQTSAEALTDDTNEDAKARCARLEMLARSAKASTLAAQLESQTGNYADERRHFARTATREILSKIENTQQWLERQVATVYAKDWRTYELSRAVVENAYGRACYLLGQFPKAEAALRSAVTRAPSFLEAHLNLASVLLKAKKLDPDWFEKALGEIADALALEPENFKANHLLGIALSDPIVERYDEAIAAFNKAGNFFGTHARLAVIYADHKNDLFNAIKAMRHSISVNRRPDYRSIQFIAWVLKLDPPALRPLLMEAKAIGDRLLKFTEERLRSTNPGSNRDMSLQRNVSKLLQQVAGRNSDLDRKVSPAPVAPDPAAGIAHPIPPKG